MVVTWKCKEPCISPLPNAGMHKGRGHNCGILQYMLNIIHVYIHTPCIYLQFVSCMLVDDPYLLILGRCVHDQMANKNALFMTLVGCTKKF